MKTFVGDLAELLTAFVAFKQSLGFKYNNEADELYRFSKFRARSKLICTWLTK
jgi:hypothetical protein